MNERGRAAPATRRGLVIELAAVTLSVLVVIHLLYVARAVPFIGAHLSYFVAYILIGVPIAVLWIRRRPLDYFGFGVRELLRSVGVFLVASLIVFPLFLLLAHLWMKIVWSAGEFHVASLPDFWNLLVVQLIVVALPEEFYFRGYFQSAMNSLFAKRWKIFGVRLGWSWLLTALIFAFAHTLITFKWWHFSIFFPALVFGYLRERTGNVIAPTLFHATSNIFMDWFTRCYY